MPKSNGTLTTKEVAAIKNISQQSVCWHIRKGYLEADQIGGAKVVKLDLTRYEEEFGKPDYISLDEGLKRTIEYQRKLYA